MAKVLPRNVGASVRQRLLNLSRASGQSFDLLLTRYVLERLLFRLTQTPHRDRFVLKGAMLMTTWFADPHRPTRDVDFLGFGDPAPDAMLAVFREVCAVIEDDGVTFDLDALRVDRIRDALEYGGLRLRTLATGAGARVNVVVDIGFGDAVEPGIEELDLPVLLDLPSPRLRAYGRETVIAEKFQAMVALGRANTRFKDFYDLWVLSRTYIFDDNRLARAIRATFERRDTEIPAEPPDALTRAFADDPLKLQQWTAFVEDLAAGPLELGAVTDGLAAFLIPHAQRAIHAAGLIQDGQEGDPLATVRLSRTHTDLYLQLSRSADFIAAHDSDRGEALFIDTQRFLSNKAGLKAVGIAMDRIAHVWWRQSPPSTSMSVSWPIVWLANFRPMATPRRCCAATATP